jgi:hypothetical protein
MVSVQQTVCLPVAHVLQNMHEPSRVSVNKKVAILANFVVDKGVNEKHIQVIQDKKRISAPRRCLAG